MFLASKLKSPAHDHEMDYSDGYSQTNLFCEIRPLNLLITQSYLPRKSIEHHPVS